MIRDLLSAVDALVEQAHHGDPEFLMLFLALITLPFAVLKRVRS